MKILLQITKLISSLERLSNQQLFFRSVINDGILFSRTTQQNYTISASYKVITKKTIHVSILTLFYDSNHYMPAFKWFGKALLPCFRWNGMFNFK